MSEEKVRVECMLEFKDLEFDTRRSPGDTWETRPDRAMGLENKEFVRRIDEDGNPIASQYPWGEPREDRWLENAYVPDGDWNRVVACLNIWDDLEAFKASYESWYPYVDHVIAVDGAYHGAPVHEAASTDGTLEFLESLEKVELIHAPEDRLWEDQIEKRNVYFERAEPGDLLFVVDADEIVHNAERLQDLPQFEVGWVPYSKEIYYKKQNFPRLFDASINPYYEGRHYWLYGDRGFLVDCQVGGAGYDHAFIPISIDNVTARQKRSKERAWKQRMVGTAQFEKESKVGDTARGGRESLRILHVTSIDAGMVVFRLHSAINATSPHESVMSSSRNDRVYNSPYQWDLNENREIVRGAAKECDIIHCHLSFQDYERLAVPTNAPIVIHHHGSMYRHNPDVRNRRDNRKASVRLVSNPELLQYGENLHFLPNPVPVARYKRMRDLLYSPHPDGETIRVGHSPSKRHLKGTEEFLQVIDELQSEGFSVEPVLIEDRTHAESLRLKAAKCDLFFDAFFLGMQCSGIEAAAMGIPVIAGDEENKAYYKKELGGTPYDYANNKKQLKNVLVDLIQDRDFRERSADTVFRWVEHTHDYAAVTERYLDILDEELNWRERLSLGNEVFLHE